MMPWDSDERKHYAILYVDAILIIFNINNVFLAENI